MAINPQNPFAGLIGQKFQQMQASSPLVGQLMDSFFPELSPTGATRPTQTSGPEVQTASLGGSQGGGNEVEAYIRQAAQARGIDPDVAVRVAKAEGGLENPYQRSTLKAPKSQRVPGTENSWGPFQLYISGANAGLGDRALAAGVDPRKDWKAGVDFALDEAARVGWGQWYGAAHVGIGKFDGIRGAKPVGVTGGAEPPSPSAAQVPGSAGTYTQAMKDREGGSDFALTGFQPAPTNASSEPQPQQRQSSGAPRVSMQTSEGTTGAQRPQPIHADVARALQQGNLGVLRSLSPAAMVQVMAEYGKGIAPMIEVKDV